MAIEIDVSEAEKANLQFYEALNDSDLDKMEEVWSHTMTARCIHPGWDVLVGWSAIRESWHSIFTAGGSLNVEAAEVEISVFGEVAWVQCLEQIRNQNESGDQMSVARATNLFVRESGRWRMVLHHASPIPSPLESDDLGMVH
ncbi:MAG: nuclear transport factor 2 family protein [Acidobacteria bacterium]|nr:nuclear transport factor 2 family protein [Acidobacteriota bacterium]